MRALNQSLLAVFCTLLSATTVDAAQWAQLYGTGGRVSDVLPTADGGFVAVGSWAIGTPDIDARVWKVNAEGDIVWQKILRHNGEDYLSSLQHANGGGYVVAGLTYSVQTRESDALVVKLDASGDVIWQRSYGGVGTEAARSVFPLANGGYIVAGSVSLGPSGEADAWVLRLDEDGHVLWQKSYGSALDDWANSARPTPDGGYVVVGSTFWMDADFHRDAWILKLDAEGAVLWQRSYGGPSEEQFSSVAPTSDGGVVVAGYTFSYGAGNQDAWVLRLDRTGNVLWQRAYGGPGPDWATSIRSAPDGGYIVAGGFRVGGVAGSDTGGRPNAWVLKLDIAGSIVWQKLYGGAATYHASASAEPTAEGGYVVGGFQFHPYTEVWILKIDAMGSIAGCTALVDARAAAAVTPAIPRATVATSVGTNVAPVATASVPVDLIQPSVRSCTDASPAVRLRAIEYHHRSYGHFFVTPLPEEIHALDVGTIGGWARTGHAFYVDAIGAAGASSVCRFWSGQTFAPKSSHFYAASKEECATVKENPDWSFEGEVFAVGVPYLGVLCGEGTVPLYRLYNNGNGGAPNHRYTTSPSAREDMVLQGWVAEGIGLGLLGCVPAL